MLFEKYARAVSKMPFELCRKLRLLQRMVVEREYEAPTGFKRCHHSVKGFRRCRADADHADSSDDLVPTGQFCSGFDLVKFVVKPLATRLFQHVGR